MLKLSSKFDFKTVQHKLHGKINLIEYTTT